jgi:hypothetical protein
MSGHTFLRYLFGRVAGPIGGYSTLYRHRTRPRLRHNPIPYIGENPTTAVFTRSNIGELTETEADTLRPFKSGALFWRKNTD